MFGRKAAKAADNAAAAVIYAGQKVGGQKGRRAASAVTSAALGRHYEECTDTNCSTCSQR